MALEWNYNEGYVDVSMPGYIEKALQCFTHPTPDQPQHAPRQWTAPQYGAPIQYADNEDTTEPLPKEGITRLQQIFGTFLYYARAVNPTMLVALSTLTAAQTRERKQQRKRQYNCSTTRLHTWMPKYPITQAT